MRENKAGTIPILLRYMKIKEDLAGQYYDQVPPIMTTDGTASADLQKKYLDQAVNCSYTQRVGVRGKDS